MRFLVAGLLTFTGAAAISAQAPDDIKLKLVPIENKSKDRLNAIRVDTMGRIFIGGYDTVWVCEPKANGEYHPRKPLYRFPERTWINDIEVRGDNLYVLTANALYVFVDGVRKRDGFLPRKLLWGVAGLPPMLAEEGSEFRAGPTFYDDAILPAELRGRLLTVRGGRIASFDVEPHGASFTAKAGATTRSAAPNIWAVGRGGRLFTAYESVEMITTLNDDAKIPFEPFESTDVLRAEIIQSRNE